eukprot:GHVN01018939.1.p1 GENE.GHVN01018939.1~~GHVN01018939.1.p1  ORF type:complete len:230 (-),score=3.33 GHVN01018939.1:428-1117(-)
MPPLKRCKSTNMVVENLKRWPNMGDAVRKYVKACIPCARNRWPVQSTVTMVLSKPQPIELVSLDYVGPRNNNGKNYSYLATTDHCTRFVMTFPLLSEELSSKHVIKSVREGWLPVFAAARAILSDDGSCCTSKEYGDYVTGEIMARVFSIPVLPSRECYQRVKCHNAIEYGVKCALQQEPTILTFPEILRHVTMACNASYQSAIGNAPFSALCLLKGTDPSRDAISGDN